MNPHSTGKKGPNQSALWERINKTQLSKERIGDLTNFKSGPVNYKLALWNPETNGVRYLKSLLFNLCKMLPHSSWEQLGRIKHREIGSPIFIRFGEYQICMDYLQALYEIAFIKDSLQGRDNPTILEIGAGYGRTCHSILSNFEVCLYYIVDLENSLWLAQRYLKEVLEQDQFERIRFVLADSFKSSLGQAEVDLSINIDSFAEMDASVVNYYLEYVNHHSHMFYVKNPVGKYYDPSLDKHHEGEEPVALALNTGLLRTVIDIFDPHEIGMQAPEFVRVYAPGKGWFCVANSWAPPWSHYWQAIYHRDDAP